MRYKAVVGDYVAYAIWVGHCRIDAIVLTGYWTPYPTGFNYYQCWNQGFDVVTLTTSIDYNR